jgi:glycosyltransferase involved in cell wall biosynthesis
MAKPVVGSRIGGVEEVIEDGVTGLLVNPGDAPDLAEKLIQLIRDPEQRKQMGEAAYQRASSTYRAENHAAAVMKVYEFILRNERVKR